MQLAKPDGTRGHQPMTPTTTTKKQPAAYFDMDRTLLRINSGSRWIAFLRKRGEGSLGLVLKSVLWAAQYKLSILDMEMLATRLVGDMTGDSEAEMIEKRALCFDSEGVKAIAPLARETLAQHRAQGHAVVMLTSSTQYIAEPLARFLEIAHVLSTRLHEQDGRFAGTCDRPTCYGSGKNHHTKHNTKQHNNNQTQNNKNTDSFSDLPMLERVGERRIINPDRRLQRHARKQGWPIAYW